MAVLLPPIDWGFISRLSKDYDFYFEHGRCIVRLYPRHIKQPATPAQRATWQGLKRAQYDYRRMGSGNTQAWKRLCQGSTWRARDYHTKLFLEEYARRPYINSMCFLGRVLAYPWGWIIETRTRPPFIPQMHWRYDLEPGRSSPARWNHVGHKIRNKRFLRKWSLDLNLPNVDQSPFCTIPGLCEFTFVPPHPGAVLWCWFDSLPWAPENYLRVSSGLYKIPLVWPRI